MIGQHHHQGSEDDVNTIAMYGEMIDAYMTRLRDLADRADHIERFYLFMTDEQLYDLEYELSNSVAAKAFYDRLLDQYRAWRAEMGEAQWQDILVQNNALNGANRNWALEEL